MDRIARLEESALPLTSAVPASFVVEELTDAENLIRFSSFQPWLDGAQPHMIEGRIERSLAALEVLPPEVELERSVRAPTTMALVARSDDVTVGIEVGLNYTVFRVSATTVEAVERLARQIHARAEMAMEQTKVPIRVWTNHRGGSYDVRFLEAPVWHDIASNYPKRVRPQLQTLMGASRPAIDSPRLILWSGEPGTGKTTAVRALASAWKSWCQLQYVSDPEHLFNESGYLAELLYESAHEPQGPTLNSPSHPDDTWRLIVAEDTDEFLRANARDRAGAALGRVLNLSDGIFGQHHNVMLLLTTNEEITRLHPALVRPGRCLSNVEFTRFPVGESKKWLGNHAIRVTQPMTLAELLSARGDIPPGAEAREASPPIGAYL